MYLSWPLLVPVAPSAGNDHQEHAQDAPGALQGPALAVCRILGQWTQGGGFVGENALGLARDLVTQCVGVYE